MSKAPSVISEKWVESLMQVEQLLVDLHRLSVGVRVDLRELALGLVVAHQIVDAPHVGHDRVDGRVALGRIRRPTAPRRCACP